MLLLSPSSTAANANECEQVLTQQQQQQQQQQGTVCSPCIISAAVPTDYLSLDAYSFCGRTPSVPALGLGL